MLRCISGQLGHACSYEVSIYLTALQGSSATCKSPLSNRSPLAEQPQQVGCRLGLLPDLACLGALPHSGLQTLMQEKGKAAEVNAG